MDWLALSGPSGSVALRELGTWVDGVRVELGRGKGGEWREFLGK